MSSFSQVFPAFPHAAALWDPATVLKLRNSSRRNNVTCKGTTARMTRCLWGPAANQDDDCPLENIQQLTGLIGQLRALTPSAAAEKEGLLYELAGAMLCNKYHQGQASRLVRGWQSSMQAEDVRLGASAKASSTGTAARPATDSRTDSAAEVAQLAVQLKQIRIDTEGLVVAKQAAEQEAKVARDQAQRAEQQARLSEQRSQQAEQRALQAEQHAKQTEAAAKAERTRLAEESADVEKARRELDEERIRLEKRRDRLEKQRDVLEEQRSTMEEQRSSQVSLPSTAEKDSSRWRRILRGRSSAAGSEISAAAMPEVPKTAPGGNVEQEKRRTRVAIAATN